MSTILKIPMVDSFYDELDDAFIDQKETAHDFIWKQIRTLCRDAKMGKLNKSCVVNIYKDGMPVQDTIKLRGLELEELPNDPEWIPKNMEKDEIKYFEHQVTDKTLEYLKLFASFSVLRHRKFGESIITENESKLAEMIKNKANEKMIQDAKKGFDETVKNFDEGIPKCIEQVIFTAVYPAIHKQVTENVERSFDKENEELYPKKEVVKAT